MLPVLGFHACDLVYGCEISVKFTGVKTVGTGQNQRKVEVFKNG